jgi:hypothetical protein
MASITGMKTSASTPIWSAALERVTLARQFIERMSLPRRIPIAADNNSERHSGSRCAIRTGFDGSLSGDVTKENATASPNSI